MTETRPAGRGRMLLGMVGALLVVGAAVPLLHTGPDPATAPAPAPAPAPPPPEKPRPSLGEIDFADAVHGYALRVDCYDVRTPCPVELLATEDGEHWRIRELPARKASGPRTAIDRLWVLGSNEVVVGESYPTPSPQRWYSGDAGLSWRPVSSGVTSTVDAVPPGGVLEVACADPAKPPFQCEAATLVVTLPGTGELAALTNRPGLELRTTGMVSVAADGNLWLTGRLPGIGRLGFAASPDNGRTWSVGELPEYPGPPPTRVDISVSRDALYVIQIGELSDTDDGLIAIFRTVDGGRNWQQTWLGNGVREPRVAVGAVVATTDGRLLVNAWPDPMFVSTDGGASFVPMGEAGVVRWTRVGYVVAPTGQSDRIRMSWNGVDWREVTIAPS